MYQNILVPLDGSALAECTLPHVINLAKEGSIGEAVIITVSFPQNAPLEYWTPRRDEFIKYLSNIQARLDAEGVKARTEYLEGGRPAEIISDYAHKNAIDMIIIATHGYTGLRKMVLGSVALEVLHDARVPVLIVKPCP